MSNAAVQSISPTQGPTSGNTLLTITGSGFTGATVVLFTPSGGSSVGAAPISVSDTQITVNTPAVSQAGIVDVQVNVPTGSSPIVPADQFTYTSVVPAVTGISPATGPTTGNTPVTITGSNFTGATAVLFGAIGATPASITDTQIVVNSPASSAGVVDVQVSTPNGLSPAVPADQFTYAVPATVNALFAVVNQTGVPDDLVFVKFLGADIVAGSVPQTYGDGQLLASGDSTDSQSYTLADMTAAMPNGPSTPLPIFQLNNYSGGRIYFSLGAALNATSPLPGAQNPKDLDFTTVYSYVEPSIFPTAAAGNTNIDASYVDFVGLPVDIAIKNRATGALVNPPANNPLTSPPGDALFNALTSDSQVPKGAIVTAATKTPSVTIGGTARILSPSLYEASLIPADSIYHTWTAANQLLAQMQSAGTTLNVASYTTTDTGVSVPKGTLFGFAGVVVTTPAIGPEWQVGQDYTLTATAAADLNPGGANPLIPSLQGVPGIVMTGTGGTVGSFSIYLQNSDLDAQTGIYGANPPYIVVWNGAAYSLASIVNDLSGRVVGDLLAGFNFGWALAATTVSAQATATNTQANLTNSVFATSLAQTQIGQLTTGQFFYLLSLQPTVQDVALWFGAGIQSNPLYYNNYASDFQSLTSAYNMAFTDRLQSVTNPDIFFTPADDIYVEITLLPGAYTVTTS